MSCKLLICGECTTRVDGRGLCASCVASAAVAPVQTEVAADASKLPIALSAGILTALVLLTWGLLEATLPGSAWW